MVRDRYAKNAGAVFSLKYHVVWCPKYRRPVLVPPVDRRLKALVNEVATEYGFLVHEMEVMPDHVHLFVAADPTRSVAEIVNRFKGATSRSLRQEFPPCAPGCRHCGAGPTSPPRSVPSPRRPCAGTSKTRRANDTWPC